MIFLKKSITIFLFVVLALGNFSQVLAFSDGTEDTDFYTNLGTGFNNEVLVIAEQSDGDILVGGDFTSLNGNVRNHFGRLNSDGTEDTAFYANLGTGFDNSVFGLAVDANGKILVGGGFAYLNDNLRNYFVRLNSDGTEDADFITNLGDGFDSEVDIITVQNDGKILVGGAFSNLNNNPRPVMVRLNSDGTEDVDFDNNLGDGFNDTPIAIQEQDDGKILIGGYFSTLDNNPRTLLVRLNADGTEDTDFYTNLGTGFVGSFVSSVLLQDDGKILVGGNFTNFNGNVRNRLIRLNSDGTEDTAFYTNLGTGFDLSILDLALQTDGDILAQGLFTHLNSQERNRIVRLNSDGTEDTAFYANLGTGFGNHTKVLSLQENSGILIGGAFTTFNENPRNYFVRLGTPAAPAPDPEPAPRSHSSSGSRPAYRALFAANPVFVVPVVNPVPTVIIKETTKCEIIQTLKTGSVGEEVKCLQKILGGVDNDGFFGPKTKNAVIFFQKNNPPLVPDGIVGPLTRNKLQ